MKKLFALLFVLTLALAFTACGGGSDSDNGNNNGGGGVTHSAGEKATFTADDVSFKMAYVPNDFTCLSGVDDTDTITTKDAYWIGETEVTYELYSKVYIWASGDTDGSGVIDGAEIAGAYTFANRPWQGKEDIYTLIQGGYTPLTTNQHPATTVSWRDAIIFCNALTEWYNAQVGTTYACVYTADSAYATPLRAANKGSITTDPGTEDNPYVNPDARGFRLPAADEWEVAARYVDGDSWLYGDHVSGDTSGPVWAAGGYGLGGQAISTIWEQYAWAGLSPTLSAAVKSKLPNALGLYDMTGNVAEHCFEWHTSYINTQRICRGGFWTNFGETLRVGQLANRTPRMGSNNVGLRLLRSAD